MGGAVSSKYRDLVQRLGESVGRRPALFAGMCFYWLWTNMTFQMPAVLKTSLFFDAAVSSQVPLLACNVLAYIVMVSLFAWKRKTS